MRETLKDVLMRRDGLTEEEAARNIDEARDRLDEYLESGEITSAHNICEEMFGLEPDYLDDII